MKYIDLTVYYNVLSTYDRSNLKRHRAITDNDRRSLADAGTVRSENKKGYAHAYAYADRQTYMCIVIRMHIMCICTYICERAFIKVSYHGAPCKTPKRSS